MMRWMREKARAWEGGVWKQSFPFFTFLSGEGKLVVRRYLESREP